MILSRCYYKSSNILYMRFRITRKTEVQHEAYPQLRKTGVDAVHEKLPTEGPT